MNRRILGGLAIFLFVAALFAGLFFALGYEPAPGPPPTPTPGGTLLARVGEEEIDADTWYAQYLLDVTLSQLAGRPQPLPRETLERMINERILLQAYPAESPDDAIVAARIEALQAAWSIDAPGLTARLEESGLTRAYFTETLRTLIRVERAQAQMREEHDPDVWAEAALAEVDVWVDEALFAQILTQISQP